MTQGVAENEKNVSFFGVVDRCLDNCLKARNLAVFPEKYG
jgi:hypothetical protein